MLPELLNILYKDHVTKEEVCRKIQAAIGEYGELLTLVKKWYGHVSRSSSDLAKTILQGPVKGKRRGRQVVVIYFPETRFKKRYQFTFSVMIIQKAIRSFSML